MLPKHSRLLRPLTVLVLVLVSALSLRGSGTEPRAHLSDDLLAHLSRHTTARTRVIVRGSHADVAALAARHHVSVVRYLANSAVIAVNSAELAGLAAGTVSVSGDLPVYNGMSVSNQSTAADQVRAGKPGLLLGLGAIPGVNGRGIGVAVIDSGISAHAALTGKVVASVSLVSGDPDVNDAFGHGTHVAGIIAGSGSPAALATNLYTGGIAPGAQLINVRVLGANGVGLTSDVVAGIEWAIANRSAYNIRVINLSLGHPVTEPAAFDPLCQAVADAFQAGIVVVASAGNQGRSSTGAHVLGGITSPGNSPFAITVGALNTWGTINRSDDVVATYSSRGPTAFDLAVKPDVAAPGNRIVSLEAAHSYLPATYSFLHMAGHGTNEYMQLSGTSMAAPMVSGAVALLLEGTPGLSPLQVKFALQAGATYVPQGGLMGAGAGSVNVWSSRQFAASPLVALPTALVGGLLTTPSGAVFTDAGTMSNRLYAGIGRRLLSAALLPLAWLNPSLLQIGDLNLIGLTNPLAALAPNPLLWGEVASWTSADQIIWADTIYDPQGVQIIWADSRTSDDNQIIWADSVLASPDAR